MKPRPRLGHVLAGILLLAGVMALGFALEDRRALRRLPEPVPQAELRSLTGTLRHVEWRSLGRSRLGSGHLVVETANGRSFGFQHPIVPSRVWPSRSTQAQTVTVDYGPPFTRVGQEVVGTLWQLRRGDVTLVSYAELAQQREVRTRQSRTALTLAVPLFLTGALLAFMPVRAPQGGGTSRRARQRQRQLQRSARRR